jgi:hypothetical protein
MGCRHLLASSHTGPKGPFCASRHRLRGNALYQQAAAVCSRAGRARPGNGRARAHVLTQMAVTKAKPALFGLVQSPTSNSQLPNTQRPRIDVGSISTSSPHKSRRVRCRRRRSSRSQKKEAPRTTIQQTAILSKTCTRNSNRKNQTHNARSSQFCLQAAELLPLNTQRPTPKHSSPKHPTPNAREPTWKAAERPTPSQPKPPTQQWRPQAAQAVVATSDLKNSNTTALANNGLLYQKNARGSQDGVDVEMSEIRSCHWYWY